MASFIRSITNRLHIKTNEHVVPRQSASSASLRRTYSTMDRREQLAQMEHAVDMEAIKAVCEYHFMTGRKVERFQANHNDLIKKNIDLQNEIIQLESTNPETWASHLKRVQAQVEEIYAKFKALDAEVKADYAAVKEQVELWNETEKTFSRYYGREKGEKDGIYSACYLYFNSMGKFFSEVEHFHQDLANLPDRINQEPQQPIEEKMPIVLAVEEVSEPQADRALENLSNPVVLALVQEAQHKLRELEPMRQDHLVVQEKNKQLQQEKALLQSAHAQKLASCRCYLQKHLTPPLNQRPVPNQYNWNYLLHYRHLREFTQKERTDEGCAHMVIALTKKSQQIEKIMSRWEEIADLINTLLTQ